MDHLKTDIKQVAVVIPFYKNDLSAYELIALEQCFKVLSAYPVIAIMPQSLVLPPQAVKLPFSGVISFDDEYFSSVEAYNRLMMDEKFYKQFLVYEYILIYQLDAFVFKDELKYWCTQHYDYIGAPWIKPRKQNIFKRALSGMEYYLHTRYNFQKNGLPTSRQRDYKVGNGGFSLRKTRIFYDICITHKATINYYNGRQHHLFNEDIFWSVEVNRKRKLLNIPPWKTALKFSFEFHPERALAINKNELPFGCHAWDLNIDFWRPIFKKVGTDI
jgi:hypothetical protein